MERTVDLIARPPGVAEQALNHIRFGSDLLGLPQLARRYPRIGTFRSHQSSTQSARDPPVSGGV